MYNGELGYKYGFAAFAAALISGLVMIVVGRTGLVDRTFSCAAADDCAGVFRAQIQPRAAPSCGILVAIGGILNMGVFLKIEGEFLTIVSASTAATSLRS
jgi:SSS family solute:Na+ symporter